MRGMPEFRRHPGMRQLSQPGRPEGSRGFASVPRLLEGRSRRGLGPAGTHGRERFGSGVTDVPCLPWARTLPGGAIPSPRMQRAASSGAFLPGASPEAPQGAASSRSPLRALPSALVGVQPTTVPGVPSRGAGKAAASSRCALPARRASVVTTAELARLGSDDALRRRINGPEIRAVRGFPQLGAKEPKSAGKCQEAKTRFFSRSEKSCIPDVRPCTQGEIGCPVSGARVRFAAPLEGVHPVG